MDDELERLLHELAGQERERLRRKCSEQIEMTTCQNRFENHIPYKNHASNSLSRSFQHATPCIVESSSQEVGDNYYSKSNEKTNQNDDAMKCQMNPYLMAYSSYPANNALLGDNQKIENDCVKRRVSSYEFSTHEKSKGFKLYSRHSSQDFIPLNGQYVHYLSKDTANNNNIEYESKFARYLQKLDDLTPLDKHWMRHR